MNFGRKMMKAGVAAVAAIATLGAGGVVASTAFAGGGGGNQPGTGGDLAAGWHRPSRTIGNRSSCSRCEEMERRLSDIRKANGGHMFAGARAGS